MGNSYMVKNTYAVPQPHIVEHCQGVPTKKEVKNVKKSVKNVKKRGKSALVKVDPGQQPWIHLWSRGGSVLRKILCPKTV